MAERITIIALLLILTGVLFGALHGQAPSASDPWAGWRYLMGSWVGEGGGAETGQGGGWFAFDLDLQNKILVRKAHSEYPAAGDKPAMVHDDLMIMYNEGPNKYRAVYFDNEGHVINYAAQYSPDTTDLIYTSDKVTGSARFRLTYHKVATDTVKILFEIASPGKPDEFNVYLSGRAHRKL